MAIQVSAKIDLEIKPKHVQDRKLEILCGRNDEEITKNSSSSVPSGVVGGGRLGRGYIFQHAPSLWLLASGWSSINVTEGICVSSRARLLKSEWSFFTFFFPHLLAGYRWWNHMMEIAWVWMITRRKAAYKPGILVLDCYVSEKQNSIVW